MTGEEQQHPLLKLEIQKGPRSGETLQFLPTKPPVRLGRVVKGNSLPIKDPGISTKHLTIEFKSNQWIIKDLDSSNGTILNSNQLHSLSPVALKDGDMLKIGEVTVIRVGIMGERYDGGRGRRNPRRKPDFTDVDEKNKPPRGRARREKVVAEDNELGFDGELGKKGIEEEKKFLRGQTRRGKKVEDLGVIGEDMEFGGDLWKKDTGAGKKGRGRPKNEKVQILSKNVGPVEPVQGRRITRGSKKETGKSSVDEVVGVVAEVIEKKTGRGQGRRGKEKVIEAAEFGPIKVEPFPQVSTWRTKSLKVFENGNKDVDAQVNGIKVADKGKKTKDDSNVKLGSGEGNYSEKGNDVNVQSGDGLNSERVEVKSEPRESFCEVENVGSLHSLGTDKEEREKGGDCNGSGLGQEELVKESASKGQEAPDLAKMTFGEYFDYMEWALPKQIIEETELIIADMHKKAQMYCEFLREHEKGEGNCM